MIYNQNAVGDNSLASFFRVNSALGGIFLDESISTIVQSVKCYQDINKQPCLTNNDKLLVSLEVFKVVFGQPEATMESKILPECNVTGLDLLDFMEPLSIVFEATNNFQIYVDVAYDKLDSLVFNKNTTVKDTLIEILKAEVKEG